MRILYTAEIFYPLLRKQDLYSFSEYHSVVFNITSSFNKQRMFKNVRIIMSYLCDTTKNVDNMKHSFNFIKKAGYLFTNYSNKYINMVFIILL